MKQNAQLCLIFALTSAFTSAGALSTVAAPASKAPASIGPVNFHYGKMFATGVGKPTSHVSLTNGFTLTSVSGEYQVTGARADISGSPGAIKNITAWGTPSEQVTVKFYNQAQGAEIKFLSDQAVMVPSPTADQLKRQQITFTGHVTMYVSNPAALEEPSRSTMEKAVVYLGSGPDYPQVEATNVNGTAVPAAGR